MMKLNCKKLVPLSIALALTGAAAWFYDDEYSVEHDPASCSDIEAGSQQLYQPTGLTTPEQSLSTLTPVDAKMAEMPDPTKLVPPLPALANQLPGMMAPMPTMGPMGMMPGMPIPGISGADQQLPGMPMPGMPGMHSPAMLTGEQTTPLVEMPRTTLPYSPTSVAPGGLTPATK
jgi:hypothetical protein